jgi:hypothetical protein
MFSLLFDSKDFLTWNGDSLPFGPDESVDADLVEGMIGRVHLHSPPRAVGVLARGLDQVYKLAGRVDPGTQQQRNFQQNGLKSSDTWKRKCGYVKCGLKSSGKMSHVPIS